MLSPYENALIQYLKRSVGNHEPTLGDVLEIYAWSRAINSIYLRSYLSNVAENLIALVERLNLMGPGFAGGFGTTGLLLDAQPGREWGLSLRDVAKESACPETSPNWTPNGYYWARIISVCCSRLMMARMVDLPGYDHEATAGPFGIKPSAAN